MRNRIEAVLDLARAHDLRSGDNPAASLFIHEALPPPKKIKKAFHSVVYFKKSRNPWVPMYDQNIIRHWVDADVAKGVPDVAAE